VWVAGSPFYRVGVGRGVFQQENMNYLTGESEASLYGDAAETTLRVSMECLNACNWQKELVKENFLESFLQYRPLLSEAHQDGTFNILFNFTEPGGRSLPNQGPTKAFGGPSLRGNKKRVPESLSIIKSNWTHPHPSEKIFLTSRTLNARK